MLVACSQSLDAGNGTQKTPAPTQTPISIIDTIDPNECSLIHNINACFTDGQPPEDIPMGEYMEVFIIARDDLAERTGVDADLIKIKSVERAQWPDTALGNPRPGQSYSQVIVPGFKMVLEAEGQDYLYHTSMSRVSYVAP